MANSPEYRTIIKLTPQLTNAFKNDLVSLSGEFLSAGFIANDNADNLRNPYNGAQSRAASLVSWIRDKIQLEPKRNYRAFIDVLKKRLADHKSILRRLDEKYKELGGTVETGISAALADLDSSRASDSPDAALDSSRASDSDTASQGSKKASTSDSDSAVKRDPLDRVVDYVHIGQIAEEVREWEGRLSDGLELSPTDVESIKTKYSGKLKLQTREALLMWKERKGDKATYNNLIKIFEGAGNQQCADFIRHIAEA